ncbi:MAG: peptide chain release factor N(5)-glutamine methyltransferase [Methylophilaceae bacterium]
MKTILGVQNEIIESLKEKIKLSGREAALETRFILEHVLKMKHASLISNQHNNINQKDINNIYRIVSDRIAYKPLAYILGEWSFYGLKFLISSDTLIPRQDTELIIDLIYKQFSKNQKLIILDLGTGSGIIGITLAKIFLNSEVLISDISLKALEISKKNISYHNLKNIQTIQSNWMKNIPSNKFDIIVSNPPYINEYDNHLSIPELSYEPKIALISKEDGYADIAQIIQQSPKFLKKNGVLYLEHGFDQSEKIKHLFSENHFINIKQYYDLNKIIRVTSGKIKH